MLDVILKGGPFTWLLLMGSVFACGIFLERYAHLHRARIRVHEFLHGILNLLARNKFTEALEECRSTPGPVARVLSRLIKHRSSTCTELRALAQDAGQLEVTNLERNLGTLIVLAYVAPLIGLLGTVIGLLHAFATITAGGGYGSAMEIGNSIYESLLSTSVGLGLAILSFLGYSYLSARVNDLLHDIERASMEVIYRMIERTLPIDAIEVPTHEVTT